MICLVSIFARIEKKMSNPTSKFSGSFQEKNPLDSLMNQIKDHGLHLPRNCPIDVLMKIFDACEEFAESMKQPTKVGSAPLDKEALIKEFAGCQHLNYENMSTEEREKFISGKMSTILKLVTDMVSRGDYPDISKELLDELWLEPPMEFSEIVKFFTFKPYNISWTKNSSLSKK